MAGCEHKQFVFDSMNLPKLQVLYCELQSSLPRHKALFQKTLNENVSYKLIFFPGEKDEKQTYKIASSGAMAVMPPVHVDEGPSEIKTSLHLRDMGYVSPL